MNAVYIVNGLGFPDALAAGPAAADLGGPVLLVTQNAIPADTAAELTRLNPDEIIVAGGTGVVSASVETSLEAFTSGSVSRQAGLNRFATAATISSQTFGAGVNAVYIANGAGLPRRPGRRAGRRPARRSAPPRQPVLDPVRDGGRAPA